MTTTPQEIRNEYDYDYDGDGIADRTISFTYDANGNLLTTPTATAQPTGSRPTFIIRMAPRPGPSSTMTRSARPNGKRTTLTTRTAT